MIKTNENSRQELINSEVLRAVELCQQAADKGLKSIYFTTDKDIQRDVRDVLEGQHKIVVPTMFYCGVGARPSHPQVEHCGDKTEMKLKWIE